MKGILEILGKIKKKSEKTTKSTEAKRKGHWKVPFEMDTESCHYKLTSLIDGVHKQGNKKNKRGAVESSEIECRDSLFALKSSGG